MLSPTKSGTAGSLLLLLHVIIVYLASSSPLRTSQGTASALRQELLRYPPVGKLLGSLALSSGFSISRHCGTKRQLQGVFGAAGAAAHKADEAPCRGETACAFASLCTMLLRTRLPLVRAAAPTRQAVPPTRQILAPACSSFQQPQHQKSVGASATDGGFSQGCSFPHSPARRLAFSLRMINTKTERQKRQHVGYSNGSTSSSSRPPRIHDLRILESILYPRRQALATRTVEIDRSSGAVPSAASDDAIAAEGGGRIILLVLNQPTPSYFDRLLNGASLVVAADGAANHLLHVYRSAERKFQQQQRQQPSQLQHQNVGGPQVEGPSGFRHGVPQHLSPQLGSGSPSALWADIRTPLLPACICGDIDSSSSEVCYNMQWEIERGYNRQKDIIIHIYIYMHLPNVHVGI